MKLNADIVFDNISEIVSARMMGNSEKEMRLGRPRSGCLQQLRGFGRGREADLGHYRQRAGDGGRVRPGHRRRYIGAR